MLMMDPYLTAEGGFFHKECFKCTHCKGQLTLANFAQIKGVLVSSSRVHGRWVRARNVTGRLYRTSRNPTSMLNAHPGQPQFSLHAERSCI